MMGLALRRFGKQVFKVAAAGVLALAMLTSAGCSINFTCFDNECVTAAPPPPLEDVIAQYYPLFTAYTQALKDRGLVSGDGVAVMRIFDKCALTFGGDAGDRAWVTLDLSGKPSIADLEDAGTDIFQPYGVEPYMTGDPSGTYTVSWTRFKDDNVGDVYVSATVPVSHGIELDWGSGCHMSNRSWALGPLDPVTLEPLSSASPTPSTAETPR